MKETNFFVVREDHRLQWIGREVSTLYLDIDLEESKEVLNAHGLPNRVNK